MYAQVHFLEARSSKLEAGLRGFTLIELLVVTAILVLITGLMLANHNRFGGRILLENLAYDMALSVRTAQVYGTSVLRSSAGTYSAGYGMHYSMSTPTVYTLFADAVTSDGLFTNGEQIQTFAISRGYRIEKICSPAGTDISSCTSVNQIDIIFKRPEPDAWISANGSSCTALAANCMESVRIGLVSPNGERAGFVVEVNGQVAVNKQ